MSSPAVKPEMLCQVGVIVNDIEATARRFSEAFGLPIPKIFETPGFERARTIVDGKPSEATAKLAFLQTGPIVLELIQPDEKPSVWREFLNTRGEGVHHIAFGVENTQATEEALTAKGMKTRQQGFYVDMSGMYTYVDSAPQLGVMIELLENFKS
jgi:methylmalonyl-CoA/ethylmalonyl-CoA epimerase